MGNHRNSFSKAEKDVGSYLFFFVFLLLFFFLLIIAHSFIFIHVRRVLGIFRASWIESITQYFTFCHALG